MYWLLFWVNGGCVVANLAVGNHPWLIGFGSLFTLFCAVMIITDSIKTKEANPYA